MELCSVCRMLVFLDPLCLLRWAGTVHNAASLSQYNAEIVVIAVTP